MSSLVAKSKRKKQNSGEKKNLPTPFLKWAGGKTQLLRQFEPFFPKRIDRYIEPFVGSGAVFLYVMERFRPSYVILSDHNRELIDTYRAVRDNLDELIILLEGHRQKHDKDYYYKIRALDSENIAPIERAARLIYLNKTCFNGLYRVNSRGQFNVPMGTYKNPRIFDQSNLCRISKFLKKVELQCCEFDSHLGTASKDDFYYFDPPYYPLSPTSNFTSYTSGAFSAFDQERLASVYRALHAKGCQLMLSNSDSPFIQKLYAGFRLEFVQARRAINSNGRKRGPISELLILNY